MSNRAARAYKQGARYHDMVRALRVAQDPQREADWGRVIPFPKRLRGLEVDVGRKLFPKWAWKPLEAYQAITFLAKGTTVTNSTAGTSCAPGIPAGCTNLTTRMYAVLAISGDKSASINTPAGWTKLTATPNSTSVTLAVYAKWFATGDGAPSFTWTTNNKNVGFIVAYNGLDLTTPEDGVAISTSTGSSTAPASPTITATTMGATRLHFAGRAGSAAPTAFDFRMVNRGEAHTTSTSPAAAEMNDEFGMASGALGTRTDTTASAAWVTASLWLRPATPATIGLVQSAKAQASGSGVTATFPATTTANNLLTAEITMSGANTATIPNFSTAQGRTDTPGGAFQTVMQLYRENAPASTTVVATRGSGTDNNSLIVKEWKGIATSSSVDTQGSNTAASGAGSITVTSGTTSSGQRLAIATFAQDDSVGTQSYDANYTVRWDMPTSSVSQLGSEDTVFSGGSTKAATFTFSGTTNYAGQIIIFKVASTTNSLAATITGTSTVSPTLLTTHSIAATVTGQSAVTPTLKTTHSIAASIATQSTLASALTMTKKLSSTIVGQAAVSPTLKTTHSLAASIAGQGAVTPTLHVTHSLAASIAAQSALTALLLVTHQLATSIAAQSTVSGALSLTKTPAAIIAAQSTLTAALALTKLLAASIAGQGSVTPTLLTTHSLAAEIDAQSTLQAALTLTKLLATEIDGQGALTADLTNLGSSSLAATIHAVSTLTASLLTTHSIAATITGQSTVTPTLKTTHSLASQIAAQSAVVTNLTLAKFLASTVAGQSTVTPTLRTTHQLASLIVAQSSLQAALAVSKRLSAIMAGQSALTAAIRLDKYLATVIPAQSDLTAILAIQGHADLMATIAAQSNVHATLEAIVDLAADITGQSTLQAALRITNPLAAVINSHIDVTADLTLEKYLQAFITGQSSTLASLEIANNLEARIDLVSMVRAALHVRHVILYPGEPFPDAVVTLLLEPIITTLELDPVIGLQMLARALTYEVPERTLRLEEDERVWTMEQQPRD